MTPAKRRATKRARTDTASSSSSSTPPTQASSALPVTAPIDLSLIRFNWEHLCDSLDRYHAALIKDRQRQQRPCLCKLVRKLARVAPVSYKRSDVQRARQLLIGGEVNQASLAKWVDFVASKASGEPAELIFLVLESLFNGTRHAH